MFGHEIHRRRGLGSVEQAVAAADELNLADALRHRLIIESRKTNPLGHQRQAVLENKGVFGFLRITKTAIAVIELSGILLLRNEKPGRLGEQFLLVVVLHRRLLVELDDGRLLRDGDFVPETSRMMCCRISRQLS